MTHAAGIVREVTNDCHEVACWGWVSAAGVVTAILPAELIMIVCAEVAGGEW